jgi:phosphate-selective porin OprO/OprP
LIVGASHRSLAEEVDETAARPEVEEAAQPPEIGTDSTVAEEAAVPLDEEKQRYFYLEAYWERGLNYVVKQRLLSPMTPQRREAYGFGKDTLISGRIGFRIATDAAAYVETGGLDHVRDDIDLRRSFVYFTGDFFMLYPASFKVEVGTITDSLYIQSAWVRWRELPYVGTFKIGQYDAPFGLEALGSSNDLTFMESASPSQAFSPGSKFGLQLADTARDERLTWALGWFADTQETDVGDAGSSLARLIGRLSYLPHLAGSDNNSDRRLVHVGLATTCTFSASESIRYQSKPESFLAPVLVDTNDIDAHSAFVVGAEAATVRGPFSLQAEASVAHAGGAPGKDPTFWGLYGYGSYFLTGETRPYNRQSATFGHVEPRDPLWIFTRGGWGAWEIGGRYSYVDLEDGEIEGGRMHGLTAGLNWYWNRYVRWQLNYQWMIIDDGVDDGRLHVFQMRLQLVV